MSQRLLVLLLGDISGVSGMGALERGLPSFIEACNVDFVIANGENANMGFGITREDYARIKSAGVDVITSGNHIWEVQDIALLLNEKNDILRPANYPETSPGKGFTVVEKNGIKYAVVNLQGRINMISIDDPFKKGEELVNRVLEETSLIFVDFHAEEPMEKEALAYVLDGRATAVVGTHTHVQTSDERILPKGTAYITDLGITGALREVIGGKSENAIERQLTQLPVKPQSSDKKGNIQGVLIEIDKESKKALSIKRITI